MKLPLLHRVLALSAALTALAGLVYWGAAAPLDPVSSSPSALIGQLRTQTAGELHLSYHDQTGRMRFLGGSPEKPLVAPAAGSGEMAPEAGARAFLAQYGRLFGLTDPDAELNLLRTEKLADGRSFVRFQQIYGGVPVLGGELIVQLGARGSIISANGEILPDLALDVVPTITAVAARQTALATVARGYGLDVSALSAVRPSLWIYDPAILGGPGLRSSRLVWRTEVTTRDLTPIRELVLVDARLGNVALNFNQMHAAKDRVIYDNNNNPSAGLPGTGPVRSEGDSDTGISDVDLAYDYSGDTYDFYMSEHSRDSLDDAGMTLTSTVRYCPSGSCPFANAFWNGEQMVYGDGYATADDVVGHELTHGVTDFTSQLFYFYQSGAINESFSDVWGEFVDLTNGAGDDSAGVRWLMGEDLPIGAIRDMENPPVFGDPDKMTSANYYCVQSELYWGAGDSGGVHVNSGVNNKAVYLMTDGDTFNGETVTGLGISKVADLYYEVQANMLTSAADYADLYDALLQACTNLGYSAGDCQEVEDALDAVEMNQDPISCPAPEAPVTCSSGERQVLFFDDLESGDGNWTIGALQGTPYWFVPHTTENLGLEGPYATSGVGNVWGFNQGSGIGGTSDTYLALNLDVTLPDEAYLHFNHSYGFESTGTTTFWDGGILEYSTDGGTIWNDAGPLFTHNGYNGTITNSFGNPLGDKQAFVADSRGYISSRADLSSLSGQDVRIRFRIGTDDIIWDYGWFIDDVQIYGCIEDLAYLPSVKKK